MTQWYRPRYGDGRISGRSISSAKASGVHLKVSRTWSSPSTANIFVLTLKQSASPHCNFSLASGNERQYARTESTFIPSLSFATKLLSHKSRFEAQPAHRVQPRTSEIFRSDILSGQSGGLHVHEHSRCLPLASGL